MDTALLIIDVQNDYFPGGKMELYKSAEAALVIKDLLQQSRGKGFPVIHIQHISVRPGASFFLPGTPGAEIHESVRPAEGEKVIVKNYPNSFRDTGLQQHLAGKGIKKLVVAGMMTQMCVDTTVRAAYDLGYECTVVSDGCAAKALSFDGRDVSAEDVQTSFLSALNGIFSRVMKKDLVIAEFIR